MKWGILAVFAALLIAVAMYLIWLPSGKTIDREEYAVMSAYIGGGLTGESHDLGSANGLVILYGRTSNGMFRILPPNWSIFDSPMMRVEAVVRSFRPEPFERKFTFHSPYVFTNDPTIEQNDLTEAQRHAGYGTITFSKIIFNHDATRAVFYTEHLCGLCGEGDFVAMEKRNGRWVVVDQRSTWVS
ncbi:MAG TPA: hypothetical protein VFW30_02280 [Bryocella sp.]|nr:hypothetical protein [Bryocella sp.]